MSITSEMKGKMADEMVNKGVAETRTSLLKILTAEEAAAACLRMTPATVYRLAVAGEMPVTKNSPPFRSQG